MVGFAFGVVGESRVLTAEDSGEVRVGVAEELFDTLCRREDKPAGRQKKGGEPETKEMTKKK